MSIQYVNTGSSANKGDGDSLRTAFGKINYNFSQLAALTGGSSATITVNSFPPLNPTEGELWFDIVSGRSFIYYDNTWVDANPPAINPIPWTSVTSHILPGLDLTYDLGSTSSQWRSLYVGTSTIYLGGTALSVSGGTITVDGNPVSGGGGVSLGDRLTSSTFSVVLEGTTGTVSVPNSIISQGYQLNLAGSQYSYDVGRYLRVRDGDFESHLHLDTPDNSLYDIILGDDSKFVRVDHTGTVVIGTNGVSSYNWTFNDDGSLTFPTMTVPISDNANPSGTGQTLKFNDPSQQAIIYGPPSSDSYNSAQRVIIQGAPGYTGTIGEGGDIYLWAGPGGDGGGDGGDIKIRAGRGTTTGGGGYLNFQAGNSVDGNGGWINIESGFSSNSIGGDITIHANSSGNIDIETVSTGVIRLNTAGGTKVWTFNEVGALSVPGFIYNNDPSNVGQLLLAGDTGEATSYLALPSDLASTTTEVRLANQNGIVRIIADNNKYWYFNGTGGLELPGGSVLATSGYDVALVAGNDSSSTFGSVTINTQSPPAVYTVVQQTSPYSPDTITTNISLTPNINSIVAGMTVTGLGITATTTVSSVSGPDIYGTYSIIISPASETGLNYNDTYTFTSAGGVTNRNWEFNSLGELNLPRGGAIQETQVTNELWGTTTTSLTLVPAGAANGTQRLEIYSTGGGEGNHIHITSGDQTQTDLFLGNDTQYFSVAVNGQNYIQARNGYASPNPGTSAGPGANVNIYAGNAGDNGGNAADGNSGGDIFIASGISSSGLGGDILLNTSSGPDGFGSIELSTDGGSSFWAFNKDNQLVFPDGSIQTTAYTGTNASTTASTVDITNTNGLGTTYYLTFVENRTAGQEVRADVDLTYQTADNILGTGQIRVNSSTSATSTNSGALQVTGGVGIGGNLYVGNTIYQNGEAVGYIGMPQNNQISNYTVALSDQGKHIYCTGTSFTVTIPANTVTNFPIGSSVAFIAGPTTTATIAIQTDTMYLGGSTGTSGTRTLSPFGMATAVKVAETTWFISGAGLA